MAANRHERVSPDRIPSFARSLLEKIPEDDRRVSGWKTLLADYSPEGSYGDEPYAYLICVLALQAVAEGNGGIGCAIAGARGEIIAWGHNMVMNPYFRSDLHGEMVTMNAFEDMRLDVSPGDLTMYSSLEPCPMCMVRMVTSGIGRVLYLARDEQWGMTEDRDRLPPQWRDLSEGKVFGRMECSRGLRDASFEIFNINIDELYQVFKNR